MQTILIVSLTTAIILTPFPAAVAPSTEQPEKAFEAHVPIRAITQGPKSHWFSYYDKLQFDPTNRYVLGMEVDFHDRTPTPDDVIRLGMVDLGSGVISQAVIIKPTDALATGWGESNDLDRCAVRHVDSVHFVGCEEISILNRLAVLIPFVKPYDA